MAPQIISPFDPAASIRLQRMGLLTVDGQINTSAVEAVSVMQAGLLYTQILDACGDWDSTRNICRRITSQAAQVADRRSCSSSPSSMTPLQSHCRRSSGGFPAVTLCLRPLFAVLSII